MRISGLSRILLADMLSSEVVWTRANQGVFEVRSQRPGPGEHTALRSPAVFCHRVGTPQSADRGGSDFVEEAADALAFAAQQFGTTTVAGGK